MVNLSYTRHAKTPDDIIRHIAFPSAPSFSHREQALETIDPDYQDYQAMFQAAMLRYLHGVGHPDHPSIHAILGDNEAVSLAGIATEATLRCNLLLIAMTGCDLIPSDPMWELTVC